MKPYRLWLCLLALLLTGSAAVALFSANMPARASAPAPRLTGDTLDTPTPSTTPFWDPGMAMLLRVRDLHRDDWNCDFPTGTPGHWHMDNCHPMGVSHPTTAYVDQYAGPAEAEAAWQQRRDIARGWPNYLDTVYDGYPGYEAWYGEFPYVHHEDFLWGRLWVLGAISSDDTYFWGSPVVARALFDAARSLGFLPPYPGTPTPPPSVTGTPQTTTPTPTHCAIELSDVPPGSTFYAYVRCLACRGILGGYSDGTFRPGNNITRGQLAKIVSNSAGFSDPPGPQIYCDVLPTSPFFAGVNRATNHGVMGGYACPGLPDCCGGGVLQPPIFRPNSNATRGQIAKIDVNAGVIVLGWTLLNPPTSTFEDVATGSTFFQYVETAVSHGVMGGYACGVPPAGPCVPPANKPYFLPGNNATRGQTAKIVAITFFPACETPARK